MPKQELSQYKIKAFGQSNKICTNSVFTLSKFDCFAEILGVFSKVGF